jgi:outer membrane protein assembly factor BamB
LDNKGAVFVADTANQRILRFTAKGQPDPVWQVQALGDMAASMLTIDGRGQVYVGDVSRGRVFCFDGRGGRTTDVDLTAGDPAAGSWTLCGLTGHHQAGFYAMLAAWPAGGGGVVQVVRYDPASKKMAEVIRYSLPAEGLGIPPGDAFQGLFPADLCAGSDGSLALLFRTGVFSVRLVVVNAQGTQLWSLGVVQESMIRRAALMGLDKRGYCYVALDYGDTAEVLSIGSKGQPAVAATIAPFRPPPAPGGLPYALNPGRVDGNGKLYIVSNTEDGFRLLRLTPQARPRFRWWF